MKENVWRNDYQDPETPTINFCVVQAIDVPEQIGRYALHIQHVQSFHGRGFMVNVKSSRFDCHTGDIHLGTGQEAYDKAMAEGRELVARRITEDQKFLEDNKRREKAMKMAK